MATKKKRCPVCKKAVPYKVNQWGELILDSHSQQKGVNVYSCVGSRMEVSQK